MDSIQDRDCIEWLEDLVRRVFQDKPESMAFVAKMSDGPDNYVLTGYYHASVRDKAIFVSNIQSDIVMDIIENNAGRIRRMLEESEDEP